jgi:hypothetical protein
MKSNCEIGQYTTDTTDYTDADLIRAGRKQKAEIEDRRLTIDDLRMSLAQRRRLCRVLLRRSDEIILQLIAFLKSSTFNRKYSII